MSYYDENQPLIHKMIPLDMTNLQNFRKFIIDTINFFHILRTMNFTQISQCRSRTSRHLSFNPTSFLL